MWAPPGTGTGDKTKEKPRSQEEELQKTDFHGYCQQTTKARAGGRIKAFLEGSTREARGQAVATAMCCMGKAQICLYI